MLERQLKHQCWTFICAWINNASVHTPASLASSSLGMPLILLCFTDEHFLFSCVWALNFTQLSILSTMPQLVACWENREKNAFKTVNQLFYIEKPREKQKGNTKCPYSPDEFVWQRALGTKAFCLECHILLGLGVKGGVLNQRVHKHPDVVLHLEHQWQKFQSVSTHKRSEITLSLKCCTAHLERFHWNSCLVLLFNNFNKFSHYLVHHIINMSSPLKHVYTQY